MPPEKRTSAQYPFLLPALLLGERTHRLHYLLFQTPNDLRSFRIRRLCLWTVAPLPGKNVHCRYILTLPQTESLIHRLFPRPNLLPFLRPNPRRFRIRRVRLWTVVLPLKRKSVKDQSLPLLLPHAEPLPIHLRLHPSRRHLRFSRLNLLPATDCRSLLTVRGLLIESTRDL